MREALEYFYRLRGLQSKADIANFEMKCIENGDRLVTLQSEMMSVIEHINRFLEANNAAHDVISMEAAKIAQTPAGGTLVAWTKAVAMLDSFVFKDNRLHFLQMISESWQHTDADWTS